MSEQKFELTNTMTGTILTPYSLLTGPPGVIKYDKEGVAYPVVQSCSLYGIWIAKNYHMGFTVHHTKEKIQINFI
jgi:hypothetical protein